MALMLLPPAGAAPAPAPVLDLMPLCGGTSTNQQGDRLAAALAPYVREGRPVRVSLHGATPFSSSFLNSALGTLIDAYGVEAVRAVLRLTAYLPSYAQAFKHYLDTYPRPRPVR